MEDIRDPQTYAMIGACMEVHNVHGCGFHEKVYADSLAIECELRAIPFRREVPFEVLYEWRKLDCKHFADFICFDEEIWEAEAVDELADAHRSQLINYVELLTKNQIHQSDFVVQASLPAYSASGGGSQDGRTTMIASFLLEAVKSYQVAARITGELWNAAA